MQELVDAVLKTYGLVGLIILAPYVGLYLLWRHSIRQAEQVLISSQSGRDGVIAAQQQRVTDAQQVAKKMMELVAEQSGLNKETNIALDQVRELLMLLNSDRGSHGSAHHHPAPIPLARPG